MENAYVQLLIYLAGPAIMGIVGALIKMYVDFSNYKVHVAEKYVRKEDMQEIKEDTKEMKGIIYQIAAKIGVPIH